MSLVIYYCPEKVIYGNPNNLMPQTSVNETGSDLQKLYLLCAKVSLCANTSALVHHF